MAARPAFGLRARILAVALVPLCLAVVVLATYFIQREIGAAEAVRLEQGRAVAARLAEAAAFDLFANNDRYLAHLLEYEKGLRDKDCVGITGRDGGWRLLNGPAGLPPPGKALTPREWHADGKVFFTHPVLFRNPVVNDPYLPAGGGQELLGQVVVALSLAPVEAARQRAMLIAGGFAALLLLVTGGLAWRLSHGLSRPLHGVIAAVREIAGGRLGTRVPAVSTGEIGELERDINGMAEVMQRHALDLERRVAEATGDLRAQKAAAEAEARARSRFIATASHDLRQPMHALTLLVAALKERLRAQDGEPLRLVEHVEASAHAVQTLLNALLDISKLDAGAVVAQPRCFEIGPMFDRLARQYGPLAAEKGLVLRVHGGRVAVCSDPVLLERILGNLLANAVRYTAHGRVVLGVRRVARDAVRFEVLDSGQGIPEDCRERIFGEYFQLAPVPGHDRGLGLGLAIVRRLARLLDSTVEVRSRPGQGSAFAIRLPRCAPPSGAAAEATRDGGEGEAGASAHKALVVLIDDDEAILEAMTALFEQWGVDVAIDVDASRIVAELHELGRHPDAILSDYRLRDGRTGIEAIAELRAAFGADIPAVLITGDVAADTLQAIAATGLPVLQKPLKSAALRAYLHHMLGGAAS